LISFSVLIAYPLLLLSSVTVAMQQALTAKAISQHA